jgi:hypothetical protein
MTWNDLLWIPCDLAVVWYWRWWLKTRPIQPGGGLRLRLGFVGLLLTTTSAFLLTFSVLMTWVTASFSGITTELSKLFVVALFLNVTAFLAGSAAIGKARPFTLGLSALLTVCWFVYVNALRIPI